MKRGFTLIELLAVITILGIISIICIISVGQVMTNSKESLSKTQEKYIIQAAKDYYVKEGVFEEDDENEALCVDLQYLIDEGYLESGNIKDPKTNKILGGSVIITASNINNTSYEYSDSECSNNIPE